MMHGGHCLNTKGHGAFHGLLYLYDQVCSVIAFHVPTSHPQQAMDHDNGLLAAAGRKPYCLTSSISQ